MIHNLQDIQEKIFSEAQNILETIGKITSKEELLNNQNLIIELSDRVAFLKILEKNKDYLEVRNESEIFDNQELNLNLEEQISSLQGDHFEDNVDEENIVDEKVVFTNEINESDLRSNYEDIELPEVQDENSNVNEIPEQNTYLVTDIKEEIFEIDNETKVPENISINEEEILPTYEERVAQREREFLEMEERRRKIVEFSKHEHIAPVTSENKEQKQEYQLPMEKKFKLANIKGIKAVKNLFDEDPLEKVEEEESNIRESEAGSILKTNIATDFMEATKKRPEFRIDFNDKIAFTKLLFAGDEAELRKTIDQLNSYDKLEDAKNFLSEIYYRKDWSKADEYAQRLWTLVENKFM